MPPPPRPRRSALLRDRQPNGNGAHYEAQPLPREEPVAEREPPPGGERSVWSVPIVEAEPIGVSVPLTPEPVHEVDLRDPAARPEQGAATTQNAVITGAPGAISVQSVSAWFGTRKVLERCSLEMPAGKVTAIIGPSGCGKSVFLRNLNRMHEVIPTAKMGGLITLDGVDVHGMAMSPTEVRLKIGMVFQRPNPFPSMTISENVVAGLKLSGQKARQPDEIVEWALRRGGLWNEVKDRLNHSGAALSGGQQQRLCIARALALRPKVLLMDEPCSALDPISTRVIEETILEIASEITVVIVTHNMQQASRVGDYCAFFMIDAIGQPGHIVEAGTTDQIFNAPRDPRTGDYVMGRFG